ncbi:MAG TPA: hypothetical protein VE988_08225 [Gemmataceae bacterium]|nr:hypothetical protein [Gemmataceae bacterium]
MKRFTRYFAIALVVVTVAAFCSQTAFAGRTGGASSGYGTVSPGLSMYYDISFDADYTAVVTAVSTGNAPIEVFIYDSDGHIARGTGRGTAKTATMDVYRTGVFRVEVRNMGDAPTTFVINTN